jgi:hypothetical protein
MVKKQEKSSARLAQAWQIRIWQKSPGLTFPADLFWPRSWAMEIDINAQNFILSYF